MRYECAICDDSFWSDDATLTECKCCGVFDLQRNRIAEGRFRLCRSLIAVEATHPIALHSRRCGPLRRGFAVYVGFLKNRNYGWPIAKAAFVPLALFVSHLAFPITDEGAHQFLEEWHGAFLNEEYRLCLERANSPGKTLICGIVMERQEAELLQSTTSLYRSGQWAKRIAGVLVFFHAGLAALAWLSVRRVSRSKRTDTHLHDQVVTSLGASQKITPPLLMILMQIVFTGCSGVVQQIDAPEVGAGDTEFPLGAAGNVQDNSGHGDEIGTDSTDDMQDAEDNHERYAFGIVLARGFQAPNSNGQQVDGFYIAAAIGSAEVRPDPPIPTQETIGACVISSSIQHEENDIPEHSALDAGFPAVLSNEESSVEVGITGEDYGASSETLRDQGFVPGQSWELSFPGGEDVLPFRVGINLPAYITVTEPASTFDPVDLSTGSDFIVKWSANDKSGLVEIHLRTSRGNEFSSIRCTYEDTGTAAIPSEALAHLLDQPTLTAVDITRRNSSVIQAPLASGGTASVSIVAETVAVGIVFSLNPSSNPGSNGLQTPTVTSSISQTMSSSKAR